MIKEAVIFSLLALLLWCLHGMDTQYYALTSPYMFECQLYISVICVFLIGIIEFGDKRLRKKE